MSADDVSAVDTAGQVGFLHRKRVPACREVVRQDREPGTPTAVPCSNEQYHNSSKKISDKKPAIFLQITILNICLQAA